MNKEIHILIGNKSKSLLALDTGRLHIVVLQKFLQVSLQNLEGFLILRCEKYKGSRVTLHYGKLEIILAIDCRTQSNSCVSR